MYDNIIVTKSDINYHSNKRRTGDDNHRYSIIEKKRTKTRTLPTTKAMLVALMTTPGRYVPLNDRHWTLVSSMA